MGEYAGYFGERVAAEYDEFSSNMFDPQVVDPAVDLTQRLSGQHYNFDPGGVLRPKPIEMRYAWPAELDLMARIAGLRLEHRWGGWRREPFTGLSPAHVSLYRKP